MPDQETNRRPSAAIRVTVALVVVCLLGPTAAFTVPKVTPWRHLASVYGTHRALDRPMWRYRSAYIGDLRVAGMLGAGASAEGLYLRLHLGPLPGSDPVLVPWDALSVSAVTIGPATWVQLAPDDVPVSITIRPVLAGQLAATSQGHLQLPGSLRP